MIVKNNATTNLLDNMTFTVKSPWWSSTDPKILSIPFPPGATEETEIL